MKRKLFKTIKSKITFVTVSFTLVVTIFFAFISFYLFQSYAHKNLIQSTEFNLQLVSGLAAQDANLLDTLSKWCCTNSQMLSYLEDKNVSSVATLSAYARFKEEFQNNRANTYIQRLIITNTDYSKIFQVGSATTDTRPISTYNLDMLFRVQHKQVYAWQDIEVDPYTMNPRAVPDIIPIIRPIYRAANKKIIGYVYMAVSTRLITDQLSSYTVAPDSSLYLAMGPDTYRIDKRNFIKLPSDYAQTKSSSNTNTMDAKTQLSTMEMKDGQTSTVVSYPIRDTGITLSHSLSNQQILQQRLLFLRLIFFICISIIAMGIFITTYLNHLFNAPVAKMRKRMSAISKGDFSPDPEIEWDNELGDVGRGINHLSRNVITLMDSRLADEKKKQDLEYQMLQNQINPHFLYNTLNSIKWMATIQNATGIAEMTTALARLLKKISKGTKKVISLREEISLLDDYFIIQQYRYGGSITMIKDIASDVSDNAIPKFTLQPLLENAVFHGIEPKGCAGTVQVTACRTEDGDVEISVTDDGVGIDEESIKKIFSGDENEQSGMFKQIGILNVHKRIQCEFGKNYGLTITSEPGVYTKTTVLLPWCPFDSDFSEGGTV